MTLLTKDSSQPRIVEVDFGNIKNVEVSSISNFLSREISEVPYPHQEAMFRNAIFNKKFAFFAEQRTGKTMTAIGVMDWAVRKDKVKKVLIVCPTSVMGSWTSQIDYYTNLNYKIFAMTGRKEEVKLKQLVWKNCEVSIVVVNYQATWMKLVDILEFGADMLILDESHSIKNGQSNQHKACYAISKRCKWKLLLSGTPISNSPIDIFQQYKIMDPTLFGVNKANFIDRYCIMDPRFPRKFRKYKDLQGFTEIYKLGMFRVKLKDVVKDMPKDLVMFYEVEFNDEEQDIYDTMKKDAILELAKGTVTAPIALSKMLRLHEICGGYLPIKAEDEWNEDSEKIISGKTEYYEVTSAKKILFENVIKDFLDEHPDEKVVVFHRYKPELWGIMEILDKLEIEYVGLSSEMDHSNRTEAIRVFNDDPSVKVLVTSASIGGVGIKLAAANTTIFYSTDFSSINYEQAKARVHDLSKSIPALHIHLLIKGTVDKYIYRMLEHKLNISGMPFNEIFNIIKGADFNEFDASH